MTKTEIFIQKSINIHGNKYNYNFVEYKNNKTKVKIICPIHGIFWQVPYSHISGKRGCSDCGGRKQRTTEWFVNKSKEVHGTKYDYSLVDYKTNYTPINIICPTHGKFIQTPLVHLIHRGGCPQCIKKTKEDFIKEAQIIHGNKYDYSLVQYRRTDIKVKIICSHHGIFEQKPNNHIKSKQGCPKCAHKISKPEIMWLNFHKVPDTVANRQVYLNVDGRKIIVDGLIPETKTVYEFYGDYWHGNPKIYPPNTINKTCKKTFGELFKQTLQKRNILLTAGYNLVEIWENEWNLSS